MTNINWDGDAASAPFKSRFDDESGNLILAETDTGTALFEWDGSAWQFRGPVEMNGEDVSGIGSLTATSGNFDSVNTESLEIDDTYHYAADDSELDDVLDNASSGDVIYLGKGPFSSARTITQDRLSFIGTNREGLISADWTIDASHVIFDRVGLDGSTTITFNDIQCGWFNSIALSSSGSLLNVQDDNFRAHGLFLFAVEFGDGTDGGIVDSSTGTSVTDNGSNTVGDIA